jgi:hypothetical protein
MNDPFVEILEELVPEPADRGDWRDVLDRAGVAKPPGTIPLFHRRRSLVFALALLAAVITLFTTPAFGVLLDLIERSNVVFGSSKPAPNLVKKEFADLALGAPHFAPGALAAQAREVGTFRVGSRSHALWVVPTRRGGYCYTFERLFGGCRATASERRTAVLGVTWSPLNGTGRDVIVSRIGGDVTAASAARIEARYADGEVATVPFVWVSGPVAAGFFLVDVPVAHRTLAARLVEVRLLDGDGKLLGRQTFPAREPRRPRPVPLPPRQRPTPPRLPAVAATPPTAPLGRATVNGVSVVAGANGIAVFDTRHASPAVVASLRRGLSYACFRVVRKFGILDPQNVGYLGAFSPTIALDFSGLGHPLDGCELQAGYGHTWPDRYGGHAIVELPLTDKGRNFLADRAAARDLALFVRSRRMHMLRKEAGSRLADDLRRAYGAALARSHIRFRATPTGAVFSERKPTGKRFTVVIAHGKIVRQNLKPYAFVF